MGGTLTRAIDTVGHYTLAGDLAAPSGTAFAVGSVSTDTVVLTAIGIVVTVILAVTGWIIVGKRREEDRAADIGNSDLATLISTLSDVDVEARRIADLPRPADGGDYREIERLVPLTDSLGTAFPAPLSILVSDVVSDARALVTLPVDSNTPFGQYGLRVRQQTRAIDKLLDSTGKALACARQLRR
ncbi:hypothetical protein OG730_43850 (plasmid) [Streptomyces sp. NBC_01298]|uniref:hypothetical protein n=1 Tax=Streptomyces sp. NBC_01298 TaxID=2903817 RepID=UPI002E107B9B|nr:hypothetical protein OG730_43850 [Streptomyces sp. NBC_01298]